MTEFKLHLYTRVVDLLWIILVMLLLWTGYTGYLLGGTFNKLISGQCSVISEQALDQAVEKELGKRAPLPE